MKHLFEIGDAVVVPDGTRVYPIIGPRQLNMDGLPMFPEMSLALGTLPPGTESEIHIHPIVHHITWVVSGELTVRMKDPVCPDMYDFQVRTEQAALTKALTFFQLVNNSDRPVTTLYGVSPAFIFELNKQGKIVYNDQIVPGKTWEELETLDWKLPELDNLEKVRRLRKESIDRLSHK